MRHLFHCYLFSVLTVSQMSLLDLDKPCIHHHEIHIIKYVSIRMLPAPN